MTDHPAPPNPAAAPDHPATAQPPALDLEHSGYSKYLLYSRAEILFVLRAVIQKGCMLTVHFDGGRHFFLTALLAISEDGNWLYFDPGSDEDTNRKALAASRFVLTTTVDKVKVQFSLNQLQETRAGARRAFAGKTPETILRLQRREYYRLSTPIANPLKCSFTIPPEGGGLLHVDSTVVDISGGGVGLQLAAGLSARLVPGTLLVDGRINLPDEGLLSTSLCVRNAFDVTTKAGQHHLRIGCEYVDLPGTRLTMIQRYITRIERERKAKAAGNE